MKIRIDYSFHTDGDYCLRNPEKFGCTGREVVIDEEYFDYIGSKEFENNEVWRCKHDARTFLEELLCDGISVSHTHYWLLKDFYTIIDSLITFVSSNNTGMNCKTITGNQDGTRIMVVFIE